jgi:tripartite-type tricarboxylate transporter receptor subunit TctC
VKELIAYAKANPGKLSYASAGVGSGIHLAAEYFRSLAGIEMTHVPYKGSGPALTDLIGGHVSMYFSSMPPAIQLVKEGKIRALGVTALKRSPIFPDLPTISEAALPGYEAVLHYGIIAPAGTPKPYVTKLNAALRQAVLSGELKQKLAADGTEPLASTPEEYAADIDKEETKWSAIVKKSGAKAE